MSANKYWRIYVTEPGDEGWDYGWSASAPTTAFTNPAWAVNPDSVQQRGKETLVVRVINKQTIVNLSFTKVYTINYPTSEHGKLRRITAIMWITGPTTTYSCKVTDFTNATTLVNATGLTGTTPNTIVDLGVVSNQPTNDVILEFSLKIDNLTGLVNLQEVQFWAEDI